MVAAARALYALLLGVWAGAGLYHVLVVVPAAFAAFPAKSDALAFLGTALSSVDRFGVFAGPLALVAMYLGWGGAGQRLGLRAVMVLSATVAAIVSGHWLGPKIAGLERELAAGTPVHLELNKLYMLGDGLTIGTLAIVILLVLMTPRPAQARPGSRIELGGLLS